VGQSVRWLRWWRGDEIPECWKWEERRRKKSLLHVHPQREELGTQSPDVCRTVFLPTWSDSIDRLVEQSGHPPVTCMVYLQTFGGGQYY
ncbi:hypothetical protein DNTS_027222, partial [Danionella cerebrum]